MVDSIVENLDLIRKSEKELEDINQKLAKVKADLGNIERELSKKGNQKNPSITYTFNFSFIFTPSNIYFIKKRCTAKTK